MWGVEMGRHVVELNAVPLQHGVRTTPQKRITINNKVINFASNFKNMEHTEYILSASYTMEMMKGWEHPYILTVTLPIPLTPNFLWKQRGKNRICYF